MNCTIERTADGCEIWAGSQFQTVEQATAAGILGLRPDQVQIHTLWAGGSFGRRATPNADYIAEAASVLRASGGDRPIHLANLVKNSVDVTAVEGIVDMPYAVPNLQVDWRNAASPVTTLWWRSWGIPIQRM